MEYIVECSCSALEYRLSYKTVCRMLGSDIQHSYVCIHVHIHMSHKYIVRKWKLKDTHSMLGRCHSSAYFSLCMRE